MRTANPKKLAAGLLGLVFIQTVAAQTMTPAEVSALIRRVDEKTNPAQFESAMQMKNFKPGGPVTEQTMRFYRKGDKMLAVITAPAIQKGQAFIRNGDDMWLFLPKSKKVTRIGAKDKSMGGEASNTDMLRVDLAADYDGVYAGTQTVEGILCHKLELKAKNRSVAYDRVVYWISAAGELPVMREYYSLSGKKLKTMYFREPQTFAGRTIPSFMLIENAENPEYRTEMRIMGMNAAVSLSDIMFTPDCIVQNPPR